MVNTAVIFINTKTEFESKPAALASITSVPLIKRILIDLRRVKINKIIVVMNEKTEKIEEVLNTTDVNFKRRLFDDNKWRNELLETPENRVLVLTADRLFDYRFLREFLNVPRSDAATLISVDRKKPNEKHLAETRYFPNDGKLISETDGDSARKTGVNIFPAKLVAEFENCTSDSIQTKSTQYLEQKEASYFDIGMGFVEKIDSAESIKLAESRLMRYIWKEIDGVHTRPTKRAILPLIKLFLRTPLTPNMISIMGLIVSVFAGYFYSKGYYVASIIGALLSLLSMVFDHLDGCIARIKSKESDFGATFDTVCDYVFYVSFGIGMTVGLYRSTGNSFYIVLGLIALFGIITALFTTTYQRRVLANDASLYAYEAQTKLVAADQNPLVRLGPKIYFVMRRGVMPFYLFIFTLLGLLPFILFMTALGSNLFWMYQLYTNSGYSLKTEPPKFETK